MRPYGALIYPERLRDGVIVIVRKQAQFSHPLLPLRQGVDGSTEPLGDRLSTDRRVGVGRTKQLDICLEQSRSDCASPERIQRPPADTSVHPVSKVILVLKRRGAQERRDERLLRRRIGRRARRGSQRDPRVHPLRPRRRPCEPPRGIHPARGNLLGRVPLRRRGGRSPRVGHPAVDLRSARPRGALDLGSAQVAVQRESVSA